MQSPNSKEVKKMLEEDLKIYRSYNDYEASAALNNKIGRLLTRFGSFPLLTPEKEKIYAKLAHEGNKDAKEVLITANMRLVVSIANKYKSNGLSFEDCIQEGTIGLINGIDRFDPDRGFKLGTYATWWIIQAIIRAIQEKSENIRIPTYLQDRRIKCSKIAIELQGKRGRRVSYAEIAEEAGLTEKEVEAVYKYSNQARTSSLNVLIGNEEGKDSEKIQFVQDESSYDEMGLNEYDRIELKIAINEAMQCLSEKEKFIITKRYSLDGKGNLTLEEIGNEIGVTRERIRQIEVQALEKLKAHMNIADFSDFIS